MRRGSCGAMLRRVPVELCATRRAASLLDSTAPACAPFPSTADPPAEFVSLHKKGVSAAASMGLGLGLLLAGNLRGRVVENAEESLYDILDVERGSSEQAIKKAYKRAALKNHPDKAPEGEREKYEERFKRVSRAYEILSDPQKRQIYDQRGESAFNGSDASGPGSGGFGGSQGGQDPFDVFRSMFGEQFGGQGFGGFGGQRRTPDVGYVLEVSLEELYAGCTREVRFEQDVVCRGCNGRGATRVNTCSACGGHGVVIRERQIAPGYVQRVQQHCPACGGQGQTVPPGATCSGCHGRGILQQQQKLPVDVPPGCACRKRFVFKGKADESPGMQTGDIIVEVRERKHAVFQRLGQADLLLDRKVSLLDALSGVRFSVKHLDGTDVEIACAEGEVVRPGEVWSVKGRGLPRERGGGYGNLLVRFDVEFPTTLRGAGKGPLREQLRPVIDPKAPEVAGSAGKKWFGFGAGSEAKVEAASRMPAQKAKDVERELQAAREREHATNRGGNQQGECTQQ